MSIWGARIDHWFDDKTGAANVSRDDWNRRGINLLWQVALVLLVAVAAWYVGSR